MTTRSVTGPRLSKPLGLDVLRRRAHSSTAAGFFCPGVPPHAATTIASDDQRDRAEPSSSHVLPSLSLLSAAHERRLESIPVGAVDRAPQVHDPAVLAHGDRRREQDRRARRQPQQLRLAARPPPAPRSRSRRARARCRARSSASYSEAVVKSRSAGVGHEPQRHPVVVQRDRHAVEHPQALELEQLGAGGDLRTASASSIVAGRTARASTRAVAVSPRERPSSERLISVFGGSASASPRDERAAAARLDEPVGDQLLDRAAHGGAADPELVAQPALGGQALAGRQPAALDLLRDLPVDAVVERLGRMAQRHAGATIPTLWSECQAIWSLLVPRGTVRSMSFRETGLWADVRELPGALAATVDAADGVDAGRGAAPRGRRRAGSSRSATAPPTTSPTRCGSRRSRAAGDGPPLVAVPCGVAAADAFRWRPGDAVLAVSSSGEFRDVVEIAERAAARAARASPSRPTPARRWPAPRPRRVAASTSTSQRAVTHTQALAGGYAAALALWAARDRRRGPRARSSRRARGRRGARGRRRRRVGGRGARATCGVPAAAVVVGGGTAWAGGARGSR